MALSLLEAMSYGNCCLISNIKENTEVVGEYAVSFQKSEVDDLKIKLEDLLLNEDKVCKYKSQSSLYICDKYNWDKVVEKTIILYKEP